MTLQAGRSGMTPVLQSVDSGPESALSYGTAGLLGPWACKTKVDKHRAVQERSAGSIHAEFQRVDVCGVHELRRSPTRDRNQNADTNRPTGTRFVHSSVCIAEVYNELFSESLASTLWII